jgi:hypothetical protein
MIFLKVVDSKDMVSYKQKPTCQLKQVRSQTIRKIKKVYKKKGPVFPTR